MHRVNKEILGLVGHEETQAPQVQLGPLVEREHRESQVVTGKMDCQAMAVSQELPVPRGYGVSLVSQGSLDLKALQ